MPESANDAWLKEHFRTRAQRLKDPSPRTPDRSTWFNNADSLERELQKSGHRFWGWAIYRCTYQSDEQWGEFMRRLRFYIEKTLRSDGGLDMLESLDYPIFEDAKFDGAHPSDLRPHFREWVDAAVQKAQGKDTPADRSARRYSYFIHVDQAALESVVNGQEPPKDALDPAYVNLVSKEEWGIRPEAEEDRDPRDYIWFRISYQNLFVTWYNLIGPGGSGRWSSEYRVPPEIGRP